MARHLPIGLERNWKGEWNTDSGKLLMAQASISAFCRDGGFLFAQSEVSHIGKNRWVRFRKMYPKLQQFGRIEGALSLYLRKNFAAYRGLNRGKSPQNATERMGKSRMPRMNKRCKHEWSLFLTERGRRSYNKLCRRCVHACKQSSRVLVCECPRYYSKRAVTKYDQAEM